MTVGQVQRIRSRLRNRSGVFGAAGVAPYTANAVNFDGTNDYLTASTGWATNGKEGTVSAWLKTGAGTDSTNMGLAWRSGNAVQVVRDSNGKVYAQAENAGGTTILEMISTSNWLVAAGWFHVLLSWDLANAVGQMYINDTDDRAGSPTLTNDDINYEVATSVGARSDGAAKYNGDMADFLFHDSHIDLSVEANRRKFISAAGKPVDLGLDGSTPLGVQPRVFLSGETATWHTNKGSVALGFTENGELTDASTSPSD